MSPPDDVTYREYGGPGSSSYSVFCRADQVGTVARFQMGAAQFGSTWAATAPSGAKSSRFMTRDAAAGWLVKQAGH